VDVRNVAAGQTRFLVRETGSGDGVPVLLLHGTPETSTMWRAVAPALADGRRVLAPDLPGLGGSSYDGPYDLESVASQVAALVEKEVPGGRVDVVGHDWGGAVALALTGYRPDLVRRLAVANTAYRKIELLRAFHFPLFALPGLPEVAGKVAGRRLVETMLRYPWRAERPLDADARAEYVAAYNDPERLRAMLGYYRAAARPKVKAALGMGAAPSYPPVHAEKMLVLWGAKDPVLPVRTGEGIVQDLGPDCVMVTVLDAGHFVVEEAPEVALEALRDFLS
jgi:pimeloyl-ACP methyl ester carboxylesterase